MGDCKRCSTVHWVKVLTMILFPIFSRNVYNACLTYCTLISKIQKSICFTCCTWLVSQYLRSPVYQVTIECFKNNFFLVSVDLTPRPRFNISVSGSLSIFLSCYFQRTFVRIETYVQHTILRILSRFPCFISTLERTVNDDEFEVVLYHFVKSISWGQQFRHYAGLYYNSLAVAFK